MVGVHNGYYLNKSCYLKETAAILLSFSTQPPLSGDLSDDFTDDFHISVTKEKAETLDKYKEFRLFSVAEGRLELSTPRV